MENIFLKYPEFIESDVRKNRYSMPDSGTYHISAEIQYLRHSLSLPEELIKGKSVLDLACCVGAGGAWALSAGASKYVGVELQDNFHKLATENLGKNFPNHNWIVHRASFDEFFAKNTEKFDIVMAWGATYKVIRVDKMLENMAKISNDIISIESSRPLEVGQALKKQNVSPKIADWICENIAFTEYPRGSGATTDDSQRIIIKGAYASLPAFELLFNTMGFYLSQNNTPELRKYYPNDFKYRYSAVFKKAKDKNEIPIENILDQEASYNNPDKMIKIPFGVLPIHHPVIKEWDFNKSINDYPEKSIHIANNKWEFDTYVANDFYNHAIQHIPNYLQIIDQSVDICKMFVKENSKIIDIGCAIGETLKKLNLSGFTNLVGVDNSEAMLNVAKQFKIANYILSDTFPIDNYDAIICNWTLHFIKDKENYLLDMFNSLNSGGVIVLTDKTKNSGIELKLYHNFKRKQGVSEEDIKAKAESLVGVMNIHPTEWYQSTLKNIGFSNVSIISSAPCFTTFLIQK